MRYFLIALYLFCTSVYAGSIPPITSQAKASNERQADASNQNNQSITFPSTSNLNISGKLEVHSDETKNCCNQESSKWLDPITWFTLLLVIVGAGQAYFLWRAVNATNDSIKLARDEFLAAHPPKIIVRRVSVLHDPLRIEYLILNVGHTDATIIESDAVIRIDTAESHLPFYPQYSGNRNVMGNITIKRGEQMPSMKSFSSELTNSWELIEKGDYRLIFNGWITYQNPGGYRGYTAFGRIYDPKRRGFVIVTQENDIPKYDRYDYSN